MPNSIIVKGNLTEDDIKNKEDNDPCKACKRIVHQKARVALPMAIDPFAIVGKIKTKCCGTPSISVSPCDECKEICHFIITQEICIEIPIKFGANTEVEETFIECEKAHIDGYCDD